MFALAGVLDRVLKDDRCLQVVFVGPTWHGFENYVLHQHRDEQRLWLSKTSSIPLPGFLQEVTQRPKVVKWQSFPTINTVPITNSRGPVTASCGNALNGAQDSKARDVAATDVECSGSSTKYTTSATNTPYRTGTLDTVLTTPADLCTTTNSKAEDNLVQESCARILGSTRRPSRLGATDFDVQDISACSRDDVRTEKAEGLTKFIPRNRAGHRVDPPIKFNKELRLQMSGEKWCSNHQLKGRCPFDNCEYKHDLLDDAGKNALLSLARGNPCRKGNACDEEDCYAGHHCPYNPCKKGRACSFAKQHQDMHVHDKQIVNIEGFSQPWSHRHRPSTGSSNQ